MNYGFERRRVPHNSKHLDVRLNRTIGKLERGYFTP
jgi:hypothetical protein